MEGPDDDDPDYCAWPQWDDAGRSREGIRSWAMQDEREARQLALRIYSLAGEYCRYYAGLSRGHGPPPEGRQCAI